MSPFLTHDTAIARSLWSPWWLLWLPLSILLAATSLGVGISMILQSFHHPTDLSLSGGWLLLLLGLVCGVLVVRACFLLPAWIRLERRRLIAASGERRWLASSQPIPASSSLSTPLVFTLRFKRSVIWLGAGLVEAGLLLYFGVLVALSIQRGHSPSVGDLLLLSLSMGILMLFPLALLRAEHY